MKPGVPVHTRLAMLAVKKARREAKAQSKGKPMPADLQEKVHSVPVGQFDRLLAGLRESAQNLADAQTENAGNWKGAKDKGVNNEALKLALKLDRMSDEKRGDFLKAFDAYRRYFKYWDAQPDMFETAPPEPERRNDQGAPWPVDDDDEDAEDGGPAELNFSTPGYADDEDREDGPEAERVTEPLNVDDQAGAGHAFNDGKNAGLAGVGAEANPHEDGGILAQQWEAGRVEGADRADEVDTYNVGWAAFKAGDVRDSHGLDGAAAERWVLGWDECQKKRQRMAEKVAG